jgi:cytoskeletal protein RodZ
VFEIGSSLREARIRRGLELDAVQKALRIRRRYLEALEHDRFEQLPGEVYARGFLREYAEYLGLDGSIYVEEYNARFAPREELPIAAPSSAAPPRTGRTRLGVAALVAVVIVGAAVGVAFLGRGGHHAPPAAAPQPTAHVTPAKRRPAKQTATQRPHMAQLTLTAARGDCWLGIRVGSAAGRTLYWRTLARGATVRFTVRQPLWVRIGAGQNLDATLAGKPLHGLPTLTGTLLVRA